MTKETQVLDPFLLTPSQAAGFLAISTRKLWDMRQAGQIPFISLGKSVRYAIDDLREYVQKNKRGGATQNV